MGGGEAIRKVVREVAVVGRRHVTQRRPMPTASSLARSPPPARRRDGSVPTTY